MQCNEHLSGDAVVVATGQSNMIITGQWKCSVSMMMASDAADAAVVVLRHNGCCYICLSCNDCSADQWQWYRLLLALQ